MPEMPPRSHDVAFVSICEPNVMLSGNEGADGVEQPAVANSTAARKGTRGMPAW
jgi:hypothetical protein